jgi:hypothetical protein
LKAGTYQETLRDGIPFDQAIERKANLDSVRVLVVDENSGRMGSVTVPASALRTKP